MAPLPCLTASTIENLADYRALHLSNTDEYKRRLARELSLIPGDAPFTTPGYCYVCRADKQFATDFLHSDGRVIEGRKIPNWRERVVCPDCGLNNRVRASVHFFERFLEPVLNSRIFLTEQSTGLYGLLRKKYPRLTGSEYFGERIPYGTIDPATGYRNESITKLTFDDSSFDYVLSFDVFEHVPDYSAALAECLRILKPGGTLLFTVPFDKGAQSNLVRARIAEDGAIEHLLEPEYHGDPINQDGCLAFYTFGWELLDDLRKQGFAAASAHFFWSDDLGYLGQEQLLFTARKSREPA